MTEAEFVQLLELVIITVYGVVIIGETVVVKHVAHDNPVDQEYNVPPGEAVSIKVTIRPTTS